MSAPTLACLRLQRPPDSPEQAAALIALLQGFSPQVALEPNQPGLIYLNVQGLVGLYPHHTAWAQALAAALAAAQIVGSLCVGYGRFTLYALACALASPCSWVAPGAHQEQDLAYGLPIERLPIGRALHGVAYELGIKTLGQLLRLPRAEVASRLGAKAAALQRWAQEGNHLPLASAGHRLPCVAHAAVEPADADVQRLSFVCKGLLAQVVAQACAQRSQLAALHITLVLEGGGSLCPKPPKRLTRTLAAGRPGRKEAPWLDLLRLALAAWALPEPVQAVHLAADLTAHTVQQLSLWPAAQARDSGHVIAAIAQLRATFGDDAVTCAELTDAHRPEQRFRYSPVHALAPLPKAGAWPRASAAPGSRLGTVQLVRQVFAVPRPLGMGLHPQTLRALAHTLEAPARVGLHLAPQPVRTALPRGPYRYSGGWWQAPCDRDYYYLPRSDGAWLWAYFGIPARPNIC